jgi:hypothetical protein
MITLINSFGKVAMVLAVLGMVGLALLAFFTDVFIR